VNELPFAIIATIAVFLAVVPAVTLAAKALLVLRRRHATDIPSFGSSGTILLIAGPALGAAVWFVSAGLHQFEPGRAVATCLAEHLGEEGCEGALVFAMLVALLTASVFTRRLARERQAAPGRRLAAGDARVERLRAHCARHPALRARANQMVLVEGATDPLRTRGLWRPVVEVDAALLDRLDAQALDAALLHEAAHAAARDPLRQLVASASLALNSLASLLRPELTRWRIAREAACDREAVRLGADPLALAQALVTVARPSATAPPVFASTLIGGELSALQTRVQLLLDYARRGPPSARHAPPMLGLGLLLLSMSPHALGSGLLDALHHGIEAALRLLVAW
jgi:Zn-dependent protease with chaperone function